MHFIGGYADFKASTGWLKNFKARHGIRELIVQGESLSSEISAAESFKRKFLDYVKDNGFAKENVYNCDETGINWKALPRKSLACRQEKLHQDSKSVRSVLQRWFVQNASGEHALPLLVIGKRIQDVSKT